MLTNGTLVHPAEDPHERSLWLATADIPEMPPLTSDVHADVCVIGAGIAGLSVAYELARQGRSVVVLDDGPIGGGMTQSTSAHLASAIDDRYFEIERLHGAEGARLAAESHSAAIERIEQIARREQIACQFQRVNGYLFSTPGDDPRILEWELGASLRAGLRGVERLERAPLPGFDTGPCLSFPNQAQFHPLLYLAGLVPVIERAGGRIFTNSHADEIQGGTPARVTVGNHVVTVDAIVVATNAPVNDLLAVHSKQAAFQSYVIGMKIPRRSIEPALFWDTGTPAGASGGRAYHYLRLFSPFEGVADTLIIGGEDHRTGQAPDGDPYAALESWARRRFPNLGAVEARWSGQLLESVDGLAFIGRSPGDHDNVYVVTGDSGMGLTHAVIASMLISDLIADRPNEWETLYSPSRSTLAALGRFALGALNSTAQYADWLTRGDVASPDEIQPDQGAVVRRGMTKLAVYRDSEGELHECSAVCPHLAGIVRWNDAEKSWDCPCHGSRFDRFGNVLSGPANRNLTPSETVTRSALA